MAPKREKSGGAEGGERAKKAKKQSKPMEAPARPPGGTLCFLLKRPADVMSVEDFEEAKNKTLSITGLSSHPAKKVVASMQEGDEVFFYSSAPKKKSKDAAEPGITGLCTVVKGPYADPEDEGERGFLAFDLRLEETFDPPILLSQLKEHKDSELEGLALFSQPMLPVSWVSEEHFNYIYDTLAPQEGGQ